jgi:hypothetical protein
VDFEHDMVVAVFGGEDSAALSRVQILSVDREKGRLVIRYREERRTVSDNDERTPFHIVVTARQAGPAQFVEIPSAPSVTLATAAIPATIDASAAIEREQGGAVPIPFRTIGRGDDSRMTLRRELVMRSVGQWDLVWHRHMDGTRPEIDFSREMIIGVFGGGHGEASGIEIVEVSLVNGEAVVRYVERSEKALPAGRSAFHLIAIPARRAGVRFVRQTGD